MYITFKYIPFGMILSKCPTGHCVYLIQQHVSKSCKMHTKCQTTSSGKKFY